MIYRLAVKWDQLIRVGGSGNLISLFLRSKIVKGVWK
jgi:hypothetical protein